MVEPGAIRPDRAERPLRPCAGHGLLVGPGRPARPAWAHHPGLRGAGPVRLGRRVRVGPSGLSDPDAPATLVGRPSTSWRRPSGPSPREVVAGGISCFFHSIVGLDDAGRPVTPVLSWADTTSAGEAAALRQEVDPDAVHAATGAPIHASYWPARILRLRREQPGDPALVRLPGAARRDPDRTSRREPLDGVRDRHCWTGPGRGPTTLLDQLRARPESAPAVVGRRRGDRPVGGRRASRWPRFAQRRPGSRHGATAAAAMSGSRPTAAGRPP